MKRPELLVPASSLEVLKVAVIYGADAVYIGGEAFGLRAKAKNFSKEDMCEGIAFAHSHGVKVYVTVNILAHNRDLEGVREYLQELKEIGPDALIIADPGNYMKYYIGYVEFLVLKKDAIEAWGDDFSQERFHKAVLETGPTSFEILRKHILGTEVF